MILAGLMTLFLAACAGTATPDGQTARGDVRASKGAREAVDEKGEVVATGVITADADKDDVICRRERALGTNIRKTVCRTVGEIEEESRRTRDTIDRNIGRSCSGGLSCSGD